MVNVFLSVVKPLFKFCGLISADRFEVVFIGWTNSHEQPMIREFFNVGDNLATHQNSSVQPKELVIEDFFNFGEVVLGDPFFT